MKYEQPILNLLGYAPHFVQGNANRGTKGGTVCSDTTANGADSSAGAYEVDE